MPCSIQPGKRSVSKGDPQPPCRTREILEHYLANPETADSLEGIAEWRLLEEFVGRRVRDTQAAVNWLVACGYLDRRAPMASPPGGPPHQKPPGRPGRPGRGTPAPGPTR